ncbi:MAG: TM0996/MTH895 family glutaredoxin-like protein [Acidimicrobiia bacterium]|nr:TM0996/MTH895 family glutaredoxin-like protein [Acidimicrobiia bacterium]
MKIQVIGPGCTNCHRLYAQTQRALAQAGIEAELEKVEGRDEITAMGIAFTPALAVNGEVKASGRIPQLPEIVSWITTAAASEE